MSRTLLFHFAFVLLAFTAAKAQNFACPSGSEDMLTYFLLAYPDRLTNYMGPGNANPIYSAIVPELGDSYADSGYFLWMKSSSGSPWDIKTFDEHYIYDRTTELHWKDATSFKRFVKDLKMSPRCAPIGKAPQPIQIPSSDTQYRSFKGCKSFRRQDLNYALNTISAPTHVNNVGNLGTVTTRYFRYQYGCDSSYSNCSDMEVFSLGLQIGLYDWKHYRNEGGNWKRVKHSVIDEFDSGTATPYLPCANSYQ